MIACLGVKYAIRIPAKENLERDVAKMVPITSSSTLRAVPEAPRTALRPPWRPRPVYAVANAQSFQKNTPVQFS